MMAGVLQTSTWPPRYFQLARVPHPAGAPTTVLVDDCAAPPFPRRPTYACSPSLVMDLSPAAGGREAGDVPQTSILLLRHSQSARVHHRAGETETASGENSVAPPLAHYPTCASLPFQVGSKEAQYPPRGLSFFRGRSITLLLWLLSALLHSTLPSYASLPVCQ